MTITPPNGLKNILLVQFLEPNSVEVKDEINSTPYRILKSELWPFTSPDDALPNWHYKINSVLPPGLAGTDPQAAYEYTLYCSSIDDSYTTRCIQGEKIFFIPDSRARGEGHIYSDAGLSEFRISGCCEYHFDNWFREEDEEVPDALEDVEEVDIPSMEEIEGPPEENFWDDRTTPRRNG